MIIMLESYEVKMSPGWLDGSKIYDVKVVVNGEVYSSTRMSADHYPFENELEFLSRLTIDLVKQLRSDYENNN